MTFSARVYRWLLRVLPTDFRGDFSDAMLADLKFSGAQPASFWWREIGGLLRAVVREHIDALMQDLKYALRMMRRTPGFTATAIVMLALGTGVNVAMFSIVDAVMLRSPFRDGANVVRMQKIEGAARTSAVAVERYRQLVGAPGPLSTVAAFSGGEHIMTSPGDPRQAQFECVSAGMFDVLGTMPLLGRSLAAADDRVGAEPVVVLSYTLWQQLGGTASIVGSALTINDRRVSVIGVMPRGFSGPLSRMRVDGWLPLDAPLKGRGVNGCQLRGTVNVFARVGPTSTVEAAQKMFPDFTLLGLERSTVDDQRIPFLVLSCAVAFVLFIACANVGGLQLERTLARERELAVRTALGASRGRLTRQLLTENVLMAFGGAAVGAASAYYSLGAIVALLPRNVPHINEVAVNARVLAAAVSIAVFAGVASGMAPLAYLRRRPIAGSVASASRAATRGTNWTRRVLVIGQIGLSLTVLVGAGLMLRTFSTLHPDNTGFDARNKLTMLVRLPSWPAPAVRELIVAVSDRLTRTAGVAGVAITSHLPMSGVVSTNTIKLGDAKVEARGIAVTPNYFSLFHMPILRGRAFVDSDTNASERVVIVNELLAKKIRPDGQAVGVELTMNDPYAPVEAFAQFRIVGVIADHRASGGDTRARLEAYQPFEQATRNSPTIIVQAATGADENTIRLALTDSVKQFAPGVPLQPIVRMSEMLSDQVVYPRFGAWLLGVLAAIAVVLAAAGLMATMGWWVGQRTREIGVRIALGARERQIAVAVVGQGLALAAAGIAVGLFAAAMLTRYMTEWIYGVTPLDPATFAGAAGLMIVIAMAAIYVPVRRAASVDPVTALRAE